MVSRGTLFINLCLKEINLKFFAIRNNIGTTFEMCKDDIKIVGRIKCNANTISNYQYVAVSKLYVLPFVKIRLE